LLGIVTVDDVLDVIEEEATEDIQKIGGTAALEHPYMQTGYGRMLRSRAGWLVLLFLGQLLTLHAIEFFSEQIERAFVLVLFVPLIISSGGNSGSQAATLVIRAIALDQVSLGDWWKVMRREIVFGITLGLVLASLGFVRILVGQSLGEAYGDNWSRLGLVVGISLTGVVLLGVIVGSMLPFLLRRLGLDPAASSTPFVATIVDVAGLIFYFSVAAVLLF
jgi:magnesium transporter